MKNTLLLCIAITLIASFTPGCKKKKEGCNEPTALNYDAAAEVYDGSCIYGGSGGTVAIVAKPQRQGMPVISGIGGHPDSAFVKFNAITFPGTDPSAYNLQLQGVDGDDFVRIEGLKPGNYYIYMTGFDTSINKTLRGGIPVVIPAGSTGDIVKIIPVAE